MTLTRVRGSTISSKIEDIIKDRISICLFMWYQLLPSITASRQGDLKVERISTYELEVFQIRIQGGVEVLNKGNKSMLIISR